MTQQATEAISELYGDKGDLPVQFRKYACTVVSLLPREVFEEKPHMLPSTFRIPAAVYGDFTLLHVEEGIHYVPNPFDAGSLKQVTSPAEMARSIVEDYKTSHICLAEDCEPGLLWFEGRLSKKEIKDHYGKQLRAATRKQDNWFRALCNMADADWQRNHNMMAVSDLQRTAAVALGIVKDWVELSSQETTECPYCKFRVAVGSIKCINCKEVINQEEYNKLTAGAQK